MFLHLLNDRQQLAVIGLTRHFIEADSHLADAEQNLVELMMAEAGLSFDEELEPVAMDDAIRELNSRQAKAAALLELIGVGHADDQFHAAESLFLRDLAGRLGVKEDELQRMESWVERQNQLAREAEEFWR